ncbi:MAG TPA: response regulator [Ktedonobacteraceae bacterium]|nr:response regulator [Ktedonobacteraceae bacterium]
MPGNQNQQVRSTQATAKSILLVEDDGAIAELLVQMITQETPYRVFAVPDGPQALELVKDLKPNLLLLDYWLPTIHGIDLYDRLCAAEELAQVPTIMLSVNAPLQEIKKRKITYMKKPFDVDKLLQTIHTLLV